MYKVGLTGSRFWTPRHILWPRLDTIFDEHPDLFMVMGDADGVDEIGIEWCEMRGVPYKRYEADWDKFGNQAGPIRNDDMVHENPDAKLWLAFPLPTSRGTYDCMRKVRAVGIKVEVYK